MKIERQHIKQGTIYLGVLLIGLLIGWLLSRNPQPAIHNPQSETHNSKTQTWTCSMHPQIKQPEPGDCPICGMDLIPVSSTSENSNPAQIEMSQEAMKLANIQTSMVELSNTEKELFLQGKVEMDERLISTQAVHLSGRIEKLYVAFEGEKVSIGQKLATIYSPELVTTQKELFEAIKSKETYPQLYNAAVNKLKLWKLTDKQIAEIEKNGKVKESFDITADVSGYVTKKHVSVGDYVKTGDMLFEITNLSRLWVMFDVYEKDLPFISVGNTIEFTVNSVPSKTFTAKIAYIDPIINSQKRTAAVRTEVSNTDGHLKPQMFANGKLTANLSHRENALVIPKSAILWTGKRSIVYVKVQNTDVPVFELREVELGEPLGAFYVVNEGINQGDEIVTNGAFTVDAAAQLNSKYSMMNPPVKEIKEEIPDYKTQTPEKFVGQLNDILLSYLTLKENMVAANAQNAITDDTTLIEKLKKADMKLLKGDAHHYWMQQLEVIETETKKIINSENIDTQRKAFKPLSEKIIAVMKSFGVKKESLYVQFCPMADDNNGAFWLSTDKQISNPYYGDMMLTCGEVTDSIQ